MSKIEFAQQIGCRGRNVILAMQARDYQRTGEIRGTSMHEKGGGGNKQNAR